MTLPDQSQTEVRRLTTSLTKPKVNVNIGCWNVRTLYATGKSAQFAREMDKYKINVIGISERRWMGQGQFKMNTGETVFFLARVDNIHRHGVAMMMTNKAEQALLECKPTSDIIIYARFFSMYVKLSIIQVYAPTNKANVEDKDNFYEQLQTVVDSVHKHDILLVMGDLNAKVGEDNEGYENIIGSQGVGERNDNGERLVDFCGLNNLVVTGTIFPHKLIHKQTWTSPGGKTKNQIDHALVSRQHRTSVMDTRAMRGADIVSDHQLVRSKVKLKLRRKQNNKAIRKQPAIQFQFSLKLRNKYDILQDYDETGDKEVEKQWQDFEDAYKETAQEVLGYKKKGQKPWISKESWELVEERKRLKNNIEQAKSDSIKQNYMDKYKCKDKEEHETRQEEVEETIHNGRMKEVYDLPKPSVMTKVRQQMWKFNNGRIGQKEAMERTL